MSAAPVRNGRALDQLRAVRLTRAYTRHAEGSVLVEFGDTRVLCTASVEDKVPAFLKGKAQGWLTAEYGMLPRATNTRNEREAARGRQTGRTQEIQRLIGRALRSVVDLARIPERTIHVDCDVLQADGGTRTASITGAFVAVHDALAWLQRRDGLAGCDTDMNLVMTGSGGLVEIQGTAEGRPFTEEQLAAMLQVGRAGIGRLIEAQKMVLAGAVPFFACTKIKTFFGYDDALDTFGVHAVGGTLGAFLTGVFADPMVNSNLTTNLKGIVGHTLWIQQLKAMGITIVMGVVATVVIGYAVKAIIGLRPTKEVEYAGLDLEEHGEPAYHNEA